MRAFSAISRLIPENIFTHYTKELVLRQIKSPYCCRGRYEV
jgi:hypothetical protein